MRELLRRVADGELSPAAAEAELRGYATGEAGRFDAARENRTGIPEGIIADGKTAAEVAALALDGREVRFGSLLGQRVEDRRQQ